MKAPVQERGSDRADRRPEPPRPDRVEPEAVGDAGRTPVGRPVSAGVAQRLQASAGNRAVSALLARRPPAPRPAVQRLVAGPAGAAKRPGPGADPKFAALKAEVEGKQQQLAAHPPAKAEAEAAQSAAVPPQDDREAQGKAANAEKMNAAKPGEFDKVGFVRAVNEAIAAQAPKNLDEADSFGSSGKADAVKGQVAGQVTDGKKKSVAQIESATAAPPDTSAARPKPVTPLAPDRPPPPPGAPDPARAVPDKAPPEATDFSAGPKQVASQLAEAEVTEEQLATSNEPAFSDALAAKKEGEAHAATAPGTVRIAEAQTLAAAKAQAGQASAAAMTAMATDRTRIGAAVAGAKAGTKGSDEAKRAKVTATLQKVFDGTKKDVETILSELDKKVDSAFSAGEKAARAAFTAEHKRGMDAYKDRRYSGISGAALWVKDQFADLPDEANQIFVRARAGYVTRMQQVISTVADLIGAELGRAKQRIADGRTQLKAEVDRLPKDLQGLGREAAAGFSEKFDELGETVKGKGQELVQTLATKYTEAVGKVDEEIAAEKEKNKGLISKAADAVGGVIKTILELKNLLLGVLAKAVSSVGAILADPISFLGKLVSAVGAGLRAFLGRIGEHLQKGLVSWLLGALSGAGLQLPAKFDLRGIIGMIASLLGLTWGAIRGRIVQRGIPEQAMGAVEQSVPMVQQLQSPAGLSSIIAEKVGDLKASLFAKITQYLVPTVLIAGITWIISLLNPASAFVKACKMIVDIVSFLVERGAQIVAFVTAVLDAVIAIAGGGAGGVPALIENALALSIPVLIGALAAILGISGIAEKVKKLFQSLSKPVMKAVDWVVGKIVAFGKKIWTKLKSKFGKKGKAGASATIAEKQTAAIRDAEKMLAGRPAHTIAADRVAVIARRHGAPLTLVVESTDARGEHVHVQAMATGSHTLPTVAELSDHVLRRSIEAMRNRTGWIVGEIGPLARRFAPAGPLQAPIAALAADFKAEEAGIGALLTKKDRPGLLAARDRYTALDRRAEPIHSALEALKLRIGKLVAVHSSTRNTINGLRTKIKQGTVKEAMATAGGATVRSEWAALEPAYTAAVAGVEGIKTSGDLTQINVSITILNSLDTRITEFEAMLTDLLKPKDPAVEQKRVLALVDAAVSGANQALADVQLLEKVLNHPEHAATKAGIEARMRDLSAAVQDRSVTHPMGTLRKPTRDAASLNGLVTSARDLASVEDRIDHEIERITNTFEQTTELGRPDAVLGEGEKKGTSEAALEHEVATGEPYATREGHWIKVEIAITTLQNAVRNLRGMEKDASVEGSAKIRAAVKIAEGRLRGLIEGLEAWKSRRKTHKALWSDDLEGTSKLVPSWPGAR